MADIHIVELQLNDGLSTAPRTLPALPHEIQLLIVSHLPKHSLAVCCCVSQAFYSSAIPLLYSRLYIDPANPRTTPAFGGHPSPAPFPSLSLRHPINNTTHLTITSHTRDVCSLLPSLHLPNLHTLCIASRTVNLCTACWGATKEERVSSYETLCPLVAHLRPRRIVLPWGYGIFQSPLGLTSPTHPFPGKGVEELVLLVGTGAYLSYTPGGGSVYNPIGQIGESVRELVLVFQEETRVAGAGAAVVDRVVREGKTEMEGWEGIAESVWSALAGACVGRARRMVVVGVEGVYLGTKQMEADEREEAVRRALKRRLVKAGWGENEAEERAEAVRFAPAREYEGGVE